MGGDATARSCSLDVGASAGRRPVPVSRTTCRSSPPRADRAASRAVDRCPTSPRTGPCVNWSPTQDGAPGWTCGPTPVSGFPGRPTTCPVTRAVPSRRASGTPAAPRPDRSHTRVRRRTGRRCTGPDGTPLYPGVTRPPPHALRPAATGIGARRHPGRNGNPPPTTVIGQLTHAAERTSRERNLAGAVWRLGHLLGGLLVRYFALFAIFAQLRFQEKTYNAEFTNVSGLKNGNFVRIAGVEVGKVKNITIQDDATVLVEFTADDSVVLTEGSRAVIRYDDLIGGRYLALEEGVGGTEQAQPGRHDPAGPHLARPGSGRADRWLPAVVSRTEPRSGQRAVRPADRGLPGAGRDDRLVSGADRGADQHVGRPRSADRAGHHQPEHRAGLAGRSER